MKFISSFFQKLKPSQKRFAHRSNLSASAVEKIASMLAITDENEFTCEQVFEMIKSHPNRAKEFHKTGSVEKTFEIDGCFMSNNQADECN